MERQNMKQVIDDYINELRQAARHPLLERDIGQVKLDTVKVFFLLLPMLNGERWTESMNTAAIAVGAVHAAFDAHDTVDVSDASDTKQQLTVLSGDYLSGIHYKLLASLPNFEFIRSLSNTIGEVNEAKTNFHSYSPIGPEQLLEAVLTIEAGCITNFLHTFGFSKYAPLVTVALPLFALDASMKEADNPIRYVTSDWMIDETDANQVIEKLRKEILVTIDEADFLAPFLANEIRKMTTPLLEKLI